MSIKVREVGLADKVEVGFIVKRAKGAKIDKALGLAFAIACFCFISNSFSLFCSYYFVSAFSVN